MVSNRHDDEEKRGLTGVENDTFFTEQEYHTKLSHIEALDDARKIQVSVEADFARPSEGVCKNVQIIIAMKA